MSKALELIARTRRLQLVNELAEASGISAPQARAIVKGDVDKASQAAQSGAPAHPQPTGFTPRAIEQTIQYIDHDGKDPYFEDLSPEAQEMVLYMEQYLVGRWGGGLWGFSLAERRTRRREGSMGRASDLLARVREIKGEAPVSRAEELLRKVGRAGGVGRLPGSDGPNPLVQYDTLWDKVAEANGVPPSKMKLGRFDAQPQYGMKARKGRYAVSLEAAQPLFDWNPDLRYFDIIVANTSGGKDSMIMMDRLMTLAAEQGVLDRVWVLHADLGEMEHQGVGQLVEKHAQAYGMKQRLEVVERTTHGFHKSLLERFEDRLITFLDEPKKGFPGWGTRYCTSEFKSGEVEKWVNDFIRTHYGPSHVDLVKKYGRRVRVLQVLGLRTEESVLRAGPGFRLDPSRSRPTRKDTYVWLPVQGVETKEVWRQLKRLKKKGIPHHVAYDVGFKRLSCRLCPLAGNEDVMLGALIYPQLTERIIALQRTYGKPFKQSTTLEQLRDKALQRPDLVAKAKEARKAIKEPAARASRAKGRKGPRGPRII